MSNAFTTRMATMDTRSAVLLVIAVGCAVLPLEITHLLSACVGAGLYLLVQALQGASVVPKRSADGKSGKGGKGAGKAWSQSPPTSRDWAPRGTSGPRSREGAGVGRGAPERCGAPRPEVRKPSAVPVFAPTFQGTGWEAEVAELVTLLAPTAEGERAVRQIAATVKAAVARVIPEAEVSGFACGSLVGGKAFGVAVPEVDIVVNVNPQALLGRLQGRWAAGPRTAKLDARKLQKSAIRACTDQLVSTGAFKFRRSAFRGAEPKVTMIAPSTMDGCELGIPINLSVNAVTPLYNAALLSECGRMEPRTRGLALLVKRWAKDRGLCHTAKGHLPPYAWTLLAIYYLQVAALEDDRPLLPPLEGTRALSAQAAKGALQEPPAERDNQTPQLSIGELFRGFVRFYATEFNWRDEAVSVLKGKRGAPDVNVPIHIILHDDGKTTEVGPSVENPFEASNNVGNGTCAASLRHLQEELKRAETLCAEGASLTELLTPWAPAEAEVEGDEGA